MNASRIALIGTATAAVVCAVIWFLMGDSSPSSQFDPRADAAPSRAEVEESAKPQTEKSVDAVAPTNPNAEAPDAVQVAAPAISVDQRKIEEVMRMYPGNSDYDHTSTAQVLINLLPSLDENARIQATRHICNLLSSQEINRVMDLWRNPGTSREVLDVLGSDLANRPYEVMLPAMIEALKQPTHPWRDDAKSRLQFLLNADYGNDVASWNSAAEELIGRELRARQ